MPILIVNARIFAPEPLGTCQVLVEGGRISSVAEHIDLSGSALTVVDAAGCWLLPGFVDALTHPCGGGGEGGFHNRTAEVDFEAFVRAGVTSPVGALGTDSITRSLERSRIPCKLNVIGRVRFSVRFLETPRWRSVPCWSVPRATEGLGYAAARGFQSLFPLRGHYALEARVQAIKL